MCVDYDPAYPFKAENRRAIKPHRCGECRRDIATGETYHYARGLSDGHWWDAKQCAQCAEASRWLVEVCSGFLYSDVHDELSEHRWEPYPIATLPLLFLVVIMERQWIRRGRLMTAGEVRALTDKALAPWQAEHRRVA